MQNLLQKLENNESVLLLYLVGELPPEDRQEVDQMLGTDAALRAELATLRALNDSFTVSLAGIDGIAIAAPAQAAMSRRMGRLMAQHAARQVVMLPMSAEPARGSMSLLNKLNIGRWVYPVGVAAAVLLAVGWWGRLPMSNIRTERTHVRMPRGESMPDLPRASATLPPRVGADTTVANAVPNTTVDDVETGDALMDEWGLELTSDGDGDRSMLLVSAGSLDVSSMFDSDSDSH